MIATNQTETKSELFTMLMSPSEKAEANELATRCGISLAELIRRLLSQAKTIPVVGYEVSLK